MLFPAKRRLSNLEVPITNMFWQIRGLKQENFHNVVNDIMCGVLDDVENVV